MSNLISSKASMLGITAAEWAEPYQLEQEVEDVSLSKEARHKRFCEQKSERHVATGIVRTTLPDPIFIPRG